MADIKILEPIVYNLISAGEVVERPSSVVKELVENCIDAGAENVTIFIKNGGIKEICITDDGCGISEQNLKKCFLPHATSKLTNAQDLEKISTLGFRGEALPSICAVSQVNISSKTIDQAIGNFICNDGGKIVDSGQVGQTNGTKIVVSNLFYNTPVRAKFLKSEKQEQSYVTTTVQQLIFSNPQIKIKYVADGKTLLQSNGDLQSCIYTIFGKDIANQMIFFNNEFNDIKVCGYCGNKFCSKSNRLFQIIVINGRAVNDTNIQVAVSQGYGDSLMKRQFPVFAISIELPYDEVDVNVHPSKNQVRFADSRRIFSCVYKAISLALAKNESVALFDKSNFLNSGALPIDKNVEKCVFVDENNNNNFQVDKNSVNNLALDKINTNNIESENSCNIDGCNKIFDNSSLIKNDYFHNKKTSLSSKTMLEENNEELLFDNALKNETEKINQLIKNQQQKIDDYSLQKNEQSDNVANCINQTLGGGTLNNAFFDKKKNFWQSDFSLQNENIKYEFSQPNNNLKNDFAQQKKSLHNNIDAQTDKEVNDLFSQIELSLQDEIEIIGQIFKTYLIVQKNGKAYLIDQHACHERILYDQLLLKIDNKQNFSQDLIVPYIFDCTPNQYDFMLEISTNLTQLGFELEEFGELSFKINTVPSVLYDINLKDFFSMLLDERKNFTAIKTSDLIKDKLAQMACKSAIKAGDSLNLQQIKALFASMKNGIPLQCPHGRPAIIEFCRSDLDKMFKRIL